MSTNLCLAQSAAHTTHSLTYTHTHCCMFVGCAAAFCFVLIAKHCQHGFAWHAAAGVGVDSVISGTCTGCECKGIGPLYFSGFSFALHKIFMLAKYFLSKHNKQIYILRASCFIFYFALFNSVTFAFGFFITVSSFSLFLAAETF